MGPKLLRGRRRATQAQPFVADAKSSKDRRVSERAALLFPEILLFPVGIHSRRNRQSHCLLMLTVNSPALGLTM
jgi:hypothetical protein